MKKRGYYIVAKDMQADRDADPGVYKKIMAQLRAMRREADVELIEAYWKNTMWKKLLSRFPFFPNLFSIDYKKIQYPPDFIYFRLNFGDMQTTRFFKYIRQYYPDCKIIVEFPDYPVDWNVFLRKWHQKPFIGKHERCMRQLRKYVDRIVVFNPYKVIHGVPTIVTQNGVDPEAVRCRNVRPETPDIHVISVSTMLHWQGIDRFLAGLAQYYRKGRGKRNIVLHLVGKGQCYDQYAAMTERYGLGEHVKLYGYQNGADLDAVYDLCDIGLAKIGRHRVQSEQKRSTSIKVREYWAKGLPVICASKMDASAERRIGRYILQIPDDESPVDMQQVIGLYDAVRQAGGMRHAAEEIRSYAVQYCSTDRTMRPVMDFIYGREHKQHRATK